MVPRSIGPPSSCWLRRSRPPGRWWPAGQARPPCARWWPAGAARPPESPVAPWHLRPGRLRSTTGLDISTQTGECMGAVGPTSRHNFLITHFDTIPVYPNSCFQLRTASSPGTPTRRTSSPSPSTASRPRTSGCSSGAACSLSGPSRTSSPSPALTSGPFCACRRAAWDHYHGFTPKDPGAHFSGSEHGAGTLTDQPNGYDMDPWTFGTVAAPQAVTDFFDDCLEGFWTLFWDCDLCAFAGRHPTYTSYELHGPGLRHP